MIRVIRLRPSKQPNNPYNIEQGVSGLTLGVPKEYFIAGMQPEVEKAVHAAIAQYEKLGARIVEVSLSHTDYAIAAYYVIATAEASSNLARYDGVRCGMSRGKTDCRPLLRKNARRRL